MKGIITKGIGGFYYVYAEDGEIYETRARGVFRKQNITPFIGDRVRFNPIKTDNTGNIMEIEKRKNILLRPPVANVDQILIVFSIKNPDINLWLLDRFIVLGEFEDLDITIVFTKADLSEKEELDKVSQIYKKAGFNVIVSGEDFESIEQIKESLKGKVTVFAGPSGVGKSTILNNLNPDLNLETGEVSDRTKRGRHTTRHVELFHLFEDTFALDTPGFSVLDLDFIEHESELAYYFREFHNLKTNCRFNMCVHDQEPDCSVKENVENGYISKNRYKNYISFLEEIRKTRRY